MKAESLEALRVEISRLILKGLRAFSSDRVTMIGTITGNKNIKMKYREYDAHIVAEYSVHIVGWPAAVPFSAPSKLCIKDHARSLRNALLDGICHWETLTSEQGKSHKERMEEIRAARAAAGTKRKERSDKGKPRGPSKKKQRAQMPPTHKSKELIDNSESEGSSEGDGEQSD
ncbi:hypothetical protein C0991_009418 [Blastosporella zonata]|nr:hypothetical protein C0991_009418 [Blastosporella zonata]